MLSQQAFSVYCDHFAQDAVKKNDVLRAKNSNMEDARHRLIHMKIYNHVGRDELLEINLQKPTNSHHQENVNHYVYEVDSARVEFPYADIYLLYYEISGACLEDCVGLIIGRPQRNTPRLILHANETLQLEFYVSDEVKITGSLKNFTGTAQQIEEMVKYQGNFRLQFVTMGSQYDPWENPHAHYLDGAMFSLEKVQIAETILHPVVLMNDQLDVCLTEQQEADVELQVLAQANKKHEGLFKAEIDRKALKARNSLLKDSRELLQTITARYDGGDITLHFRLEEGSVGRTSSGDPAWVLEPVNKEESTIPISAMYKLQLQLANIRWSRPRSPSPYPHGFTPQGIIIYTYAHCVEAIFSFDDSLDDLNMDSLPNVMDGYFQMAMYGRLEEQTQLPVITIKLLYLNVILAVIKPQLEALGIEVKNDDEE